MAQKKRKEQNQDQDISGQHEDDIDDGVAAPEFFEEEPDVFRPPGAKRRKIGPADEMGQNQPIPGEYLGGEEIVFAPASGAKAVYLQLIASDRFCAFPKTGNLVEVYRAVPGASVGARLYFDSALAGCCSPTPKAFGVYRFTHFCVSCLCRRGNISLDVPIGTIR